MSLAVPKMFHLWEKGFPRVALDGGFDGRSFILDANGADHNHDVLISIT